MIIWLASYPKSGNTWLRSLLSTYFFSKDGNFKFDLLKHIDQFPSYDHFKDHKEEFLNPTDTAKHWLQEQNKINVDRKIKFFKTHSALCAIDGNRFTNPQNTLGAIYIIRDPRNVITSLAHHYQLNLEEAFEFMKTEKKAIIQKKAKSYVGFTALFSWIFHQKSWIDNKLYPTLVIRYEDLQDETFSTLKKVIKFINITTKSNKLFDREKAKKSIQSCSFEKLKKLENDQGFAEAIISKDKNKKLSFFNLGKNNDYKKLLDIKLIDRMNEEFQQEIIKYKYD